MTLPSAIMHVLITMSLMCNLSLSPIMPPWEPDPAEVTALAQTLYGECRGCSELQQRAVAWTIFNRVDDPRFPDSVIEVITQPSQFFGYSESFPVTAELEALARDCLEDWHCERERVLEPDETMVEMLACGIYQEAGGDECSDECRINVGDVMLNRVTDPRFPNTLEGVLTAPGQYGRFSKTGIVWPSRASNPGEAAAVERAYNIARQLLSGNHGELWGQGYVWQAEFEQGTEGFWLDGIYFGR